MCVAQFVVLRACVTVCGVGLLGRVPGRGGVGGVLTVSVWGVLTEFDDLSWTPEIEASSGQHGGCPEQSVGTVVAGFGAVRQLREGEEARRTRLGYSQGKRG